MPLYWSLVTICLCLRSSEQQPLLLGAQNPAASFGSAFLCRQLGRTRDIIQHSTVNDSMANIMYSLPHELRKRILEHALRQDGTVELQTPMWTSSQIFAQPMFCVCRSLRDEALEAFYETNDFLWMIDTENESWSDPSTYRSSTSIGGDSNNCIPKEGNTPLTPTLPWEYPKLFQNLRYLHVNLWVREVGNASILKRRLSAMVEVLDRGRRLTAVHFLVIAKRQPSKGPSIDGQLLAKETLSAMEVKGLVQVRTKYWDSA